VKVYHNDSGNQILWRYDFDAGAGEISNKMAIIDGLPGTKRDVLNDGMVVEYVSFSSC